MTQQEVVGSNPISHTRQAGSAVRRAGLLLFHCTAKIKLRRVTKIYEALMPLRWRFFLSDGSLRVAKEKNARPVKIAPAPTP